MKVSPYQSYLLYDASSVDPSVDCVDTLHGTLSTEEIIFDMQLD